MYVDIWLSPEKYEEAKEQNINIEVICEDEKLQFLIEQKQREIGIYYFYYYYSEFMNLHLLR